MYFLLLLAQNLPSELQVCPHPQTPRVGVCWGQTPGGLAVSEAKNPVIKRIAGSAKATYRGTVKWKIEDDNNIIHTFVIPNTYYITAAPTRILLPQHFAQQMQDHKPHAEGTGSRVYDYKYGNCFILGPEKIHQNSQT